MRPDVTIEAWMTRQVLAVSPSTTLREAKSHMLERGIRHLPVLDGDQLAGLLSDRDIKLALQIYREDADDLTVFDVANPVVYAVAPSTPLKDVAAAMAAEKYGCAVVVEDDRVVGIFTTVDACRALEASLSALSS